MLLEIFQAALTLGESVLSLFQLKVRSVTDVNCIYIIGIIFPYIEIKYNPAGRYVKKKCGDLRLR